MPRERLWVRGEDDACEPEGSLGGAMFANARDTEVMEGPHPVRVGEPCGLGGGFEGRGERVSWLVGSGRPAKP